MNLGLRCIFAVMAAYLIGSLNFSILVSKLFLKKDIREMGSGNAGSTNSFRVMGPSKAIIVMLGDILKGIIAVLLVNPIIGEYPNLTSIIQVSVGFAVVIGHVFPVYFGFRGGKGVMTTAAVVSCIDFRVFIIAISIFIVIVLITKYVSLGSIIAVWTLPPLFFAFRGWNLQGTPYILFGLSLAVLVTVLHIPNIKRLAKGTENKFLLKKK